MAAPITAIEKLKTRLKQIPLLVSIWRFMWKNVRGPAAAAYYDFKRKYFEFSVLKVSHAFPLFTPHSEGKYTERARLTIQTINQIIPFLSSLAASAGAPAIYITNIETIAASAEDLEASNELKKYLDKYGSDKATAHDYHNVYGPILKDCSKIKGVLEIGMGTNNRDVVSNMGGAGKPGGSLRAFRDFLKSARVYGADIDKRILFEEERIETFYVDQTCPATFIDLGKLIPSDLDLIIDDGLHSPDSNIETLKFGLTKIRAGGWVVIEDISPDAIPAWEVVAALLPKNYRSNIFNAKGIMFAVQRLS
jgi:hypothetical protein